MPKIRPQLARLNANHAIRRAAKCCCSSMMMNSNVCCMTLSASRMSYLAFKNDLLRAPGSGRPALADDSSRSYASTTQSAYCHLFLKQTYATGDVAACQGNVELQRFSIGRPADSSTCQTTSVQTVVVQNI
jgi:hypothetical protein